MEEAAAAADERKRLLGRRIAAARKAKGWKQSQLARAMSVESMTVSRWERGAHSPDMDTLILIAQLTNRPLWSFLLDSEPKDVEEAAVRLKALETRMAAVEGTLEQLGIQPPSDDDQAAEQ